MFGGSAYDPLGDWKQHYSDYTTENNCQKVEVPGTITLKKWGARAPGHQW
jgi:hypothetical protein